MTLTQTGRACFSEHFGISYAFFRQADIFLCILQDLEPCSNFSGNKKIGGRTFHTQAKLTQGI
jgi:hypothetical protein